MLLSWSLMIDMFTLVFLGTAFFCSVVLFVFKTVPSNLQRFFQTPFLTSLPRLVLRVHLEYTDLFAYLFFSYRWHNVNHLLLHLFSLLSLVSCVYGINAFCINWSEGFNLTISCQVMIPWESFMYLLSKQKKDKFEWFKVGQNLLHLPLP